MSGIVFKNEDMQERITKTNITYYSMWVKNFQEICLNNDLKESIA